MERDGTEPSTVPAEVSQRDLNEALRPLMDLLGTDVVRVYDNPGVSIAGGVITLTLAGPVATDAFTLRTTVGDDEFAEVATQVRVEIMR